MDNRAAAALLERVREKAAGAIADLLGSAGNAVSDFASPSNVNHPFATALQDMARTRLDAEAAKNVGGIALAGLGAGAGLRGLLGLTNLTRKNITDHSIKARGGPDILPLPIPVEDEEKAAGVTQMASIPWYGPAAVLGGLGSAALGWKGVDRVLKRRAKAERDAEMEAARNEFSDALMGQYAKPVAMKSAAAGPTWADVGAELDGLFGEVEKVAGMDDTLGMLAGGYGTYAGLSGLLTGAFVYDKMRKRSRRAVLEKAMQRRDRRRFNQAPTEIQAVPVPVSSIPRLAPEEAADAISHPVGTPPSIKLGAEKAGIAPSTARQALDRLLAGTHSMPADMVAHKADVIERWLANPKRAARAAAEPRVGLRGEAGLEGELSHLDEMRKLMNVRPPAAATATAPPAGGGAGHLPTRDGDTGLGIPPMAPRGLAGLKPPAPAPRPPAAAAPPPAATPKGQLSAKLLSALGLGGLAGGAAAGDLMTPSAPPAKVPAA